MNKDFITQPKNLELYNYYWGQIEKSGLKFDESTKNPSSIADHFKAKLTKIANGKRVKMLDNQMTNDICKYAMLALLMEISSSSTDVGYALEFYKNNSVDNDESSYFNKLIDRIYETLSNSLSEITGSGKVLDIDKLRNSLNAAIDSYYSSHPEDRSSKKIVKPLQQEIDKVINRALNINKTVEQSNDQIFNF